MKKLQDYLNEIKDHRRVQGRRFELYSMLEMIILAGMSGRFGINPVARFIKNNESFFTDRYGFKHGVPSQTGLFNFMRELEYDELNTALSKWMRDVLAQKGKSKEWIAIDGKVINSTVSDKHSSEQNYVSLVSAFCERIGIVLKSNKFENKNSDEGSAARELIKTLEGMGIIITMDALHCKKKPSKPLWWEEMTM